MKKRSILAILAALVLCIVFAFSASAYSLGDVDGNGTINATDARKALRAAVNLETLTEEQWAAADVDFNNTVNASDARIILRVSVKLDTLHTHSYTGKVTTAATCSKEGVKTFTCSCGEGTYTEAIPKTAHNITTIYAAKTTKCTVCNASIPSFNTIVNTLKDKSSVQTYTAVLEEISHNDKMEISGLLAGELKDEDNVATTETTYDPLITNRAITDKRFPTNDTSYVSNLSDSDVKSIKIAKVSKVDFLSKLPNNYKYGNVTYDLTALKNTAFPEAYKVTVVLNEEKITDITKTVSGASTFDKIYVANYKTTIESLRKEITSSFDSLGKELESLCKTKTSGNIKSNLTVEYYIDALTLAPVGAKYSHKFDIGFTIKLYAKADLLNTTPWIDMTQNMYMLTNAYYIFPGNLPA